jgi:TonB family protein
VPVVMGSKQGPVMASTMPVGVSTAGGTPGGVRLPGLANRSTAGSAASGPSPLALGAGDARIATPAALAKTGGSPVERGSSTGPPATAGPGPVRPGSGDPSAGDRGTSQQIAVLPRGPGDGGHAGPNQGSNNVGKDAENRSGNSDRTGPRGEPVPQIGGTADFGPYMVELQRRIKHHWSPPHGHESKRVVVVFKVHMDGTMSSLRLQRTCGAAAADRAALEAVANAAPFQHLPEHAPTDVDIEFTFDYNVFAGGRTESRQF